MNDRAIDNKNAEASIITTTLALSIGYAIFRYHIFGPVLWKDFPFFILNKGLCLAAFILLTMNFALGPLKNLGAPVPQGWLNARKAMGMTGFLLVIPAVVIFRRTGYIRFFRAYSHIQFGE